MSGQRIAILIGSSYFPREPGLRSLRCPGNDVDGLNRVLTRYGDFTDIHLFKDAESHVVESKINEVLKDASKGDLALIYYSGHGKLNQLGRLYLTTVNTTLKALESTAIAGENLKRYIDVSYTDSVVLMLDCCYGGAIGDAFIKGGVDERLQEISSARGTYILTAATGLQIATEKESDRYGLFTKCVIEGIEGGTADLDGDGYITINELYRYTSERVRGESSQEPVEWNIRHRGRDLVIARVGLPSGLNRQRLLRKRLFELNAQRQISNLILSQALDALDGEPGASARLRLRNDLLDELFQKRFSLGEFISRWEAAGDEQRPRDGRGAPQAPPRPATISIEGIGPGGSPPHAEETLVLVRGGSFRMGCDDNHADERPRHLVTLSDFYLGRHPVTNYEFRRFLDDEANAGWKPGGALARDFADEHYLAHWGKAADQHPVVYVSWHAARAYAEWLGQRLPTEAEWEYAARAGTETNYWWGDEPDRLKANYFIATRQRQGTTPVGSYPANHWDFSDMLGNVAEWCFDWYDPNFYGRGVVDDPAGPEGGDERVHRGGSYQSVAVDIRCATRGRAGPLSCSEVLGFRCARSAAGGERAQEGSSCER